MCLRPPGIPLSVERRQKLGMPRGYAPRQRFSVVASPNPICFGGSSVGRTIGGGDDLDDIKTHDKVNYIVLVERGALYNFENMFNTELQLSLVAPKTKIDTFLKKYPGLLNGNPFEEGIAVIAKVSSIETSYFTGEEGIREEIRIGHGDMVDIEYLGMVSP